MALKESNTKKNYSNKSDKNIKLAKVVPLWKQLGFASLKDFQISEAAMGNPLARKALKKEEEKKKNKYRKK